MAVTGWIYQPTGIAQDFFSSARNVAEKIVQVKDGKTSDAVPDTRPNRALYKSARLRDGFP